MNNNNSTNESKQMLTDGQKQQMKKYAVFTLLFIIFGASLWLIFAPSTDDKTKAGVTQGFNADIPMPKEEGIVGDKKNAYEEAQMKQKQEEKMRSLQDFATMLGNKEPKSSSPLTLMDDDPKSTTAHSRYSSVSATSSPIQTSAAAYRDINRNLGAFYEKPQVDPEKERLTSELQEIKAKLTEAENRKNPVDEQLALMEKSYQIAAKYLPRAQGQTTGQPDKEQTQNTSGKTKIVPVKQVTQRTVSTLQQKMDSTCMPGNRGFITPTVKEKRESRNTIKACLDDNQTVMDGQSVKLRLLEPMQVGYAFIPRNTLITGMVKVQGERLGITVVSVEIAGTIFPVELQAYDTDGQQGIFIPHTMEVNATKEVIANMGTNAGTNISLTSNAGQQLASDLGRSVIQGTSQFIAKKLREVKVSLKAGYKLFLLPNNQ